MTGEAATFDGESVQIEHEDEVLWGKQTQLALKHFDIGTQLFPPVFIAVLISIKRACATSNHANGLLSETQCDAILFACDQFTSNELNLSQRNNTAQEHFPLRVWQSGSGTQTNMNVNEVICAIANTYLDKEKPNSDNIASVAMHPNDHINLSQSSNDVFPSAMRITVAKQSADILLPALQHFDVALAKKEVQFIDVSMVGRTHLMDALSIKAGSIFSAYRSQVAAARLAVVDALGEVYKLPLGGTAVGSGANASEYFGPQTILRLASLYELPFTQSESLYASVSSEDGILRYSCALKQLATVLFKIANDFRLLGSGPMCGINEWIMPNNEPGSSIMPGKVNPTQCEALSMVCLQIFGNDLTVSLAASNGQLQLNTYRPVIIYNVLQSIELLSSAMNSFANYCIKDLDLNRSRIRANVQNNLAVITLLAPTIGYDVAAKIASTALEKHISLCGAAEALGLYSKREFESMLQKHTL